MRDVKKLEGYYTYKDYCDWDTDARYELIDGVPHSLEPPDVAHQMALGNLMFRFIEHLKGKECRVLFCVDVRLNYEGADDIVVQPDLIVVCDHKKLEDGMTCKGAPDLVVEVLMPSSAKHDLKVKFDKYREAGVRELWYADPKTELLLTYTLDENGDYIPNPLGSENDKIAAGILPGLVIEVTDIFEPLFFGG